MGMRFVLDKLSYSHKPTAASTPCSATHLRSRALHEQREQTLQQAGVNTLPALVAVQGSKAGALQVQCKVR